MPQLLAGKVALVTGGSRGIGAAIVNRLARDGAAVAFTYSASANKAQSLVAEAQLRGARDTGHFTLETHVRAIGAEIHRFLDHLPHAPAVP
jgi:NAD(P)-dependent dehydrogenase (short-subunit alcohol dehydrogenase family)